MTYSTMARSAVLGMLLAAAPWLAAQPVSGPMALNYSYIEAGYVFLHGDDPGVRERTVSRHGANFGFAMELGDTLYALGHYERARKLDYDHARLGLGGRMTLAPNMDFYTELSFSYVSAARRSDNGARFDVGLRGMASERVEAASFLGYDSDGPNDGGGILGGEVTYHVTPTFNVSLQAEAHDFDVGMIYLNGRYHFR